MPIGSCSKYHLLEEAFPGHTPLLSSFCLSILVYHSLSVNNLCCIVSDSLRRLKTTGLFILLGCVPVPRRMLGLWQAQL